jgi:hypothetical protein
MKVTIQALATLSVSLLPGAALAHSGHGSADAHSVLHYLTDHPLLVLALAASLTLVAWRRVSSR